MPSLTPHLAQQPIMSREEVKWDAGIGGSGHVTLSCRPTPSRFLTHHQLSPHAILRHYPSFFLTFLVIFAFNNGDHCIIIIISNIIVIIIITIIIIIIVIFIIIVIISIVFSNNSSFYKRLLKKKINRLMCPYM